MNWNKAFEKDSILGKSDSIDTRSFARLTMPPPEEPPAPSEEPVATEAKRQQASLVDGLDRIEAAWLAQLDIIKINASTLEAKIRACVIGLRQDMARLELLGEQAMKEAARGQKVAQHFAASLDQIKSGR